VGNFTLGGAFREDNDFILLERVGVIFGKYSGFYQEFMFVFDSKRLDHSQFLFHCARLVAFRKTAKSAC